MVDINLFLKEKYGYENFRNSQENIITDILDGRDVFTIMPTGGGKSICYQIPSLVFEGITIVVSPLISLMKDQVDELIRIGIPAVYINSTLTSKQYMERVNGIRNGEYKIIYISPERIETEGFINLINEVNISFIAIDESHCVSQWGHDFRPSYKNIKPFIDSFNKRPVIGAFTATANEEVKKDIISLLGLSEPNVYVTGFDRENLELKVFRGIDKNVYIENYVNNNREKSGIIYCSTRKRVDDLYNKLKSKDYSVSRYHAGMTDKERNENQEDFIYDRTNIIIATNAFGMGIDKSNIRYIIHYNMPQSLENYYQEAGRAGRDSMPAECMLLFSPQDINIQKYLIENTLENPIRIKYKYKQLKIMSDYCYTGECLRKYILRYFGDNNLHENCGNCSNCDDNLEKEDITTEAQKIISCVYRLRENFGTGIAAEVLKGSSNKKVLRYNFNKLSTYGIMSNYTLKEIKELINILAAEGYLRITDDKYPIVKLTKKSSEMLKNKEKVYRKIEKKTEKVEERNELLVMLINLRTEIAKQEKIPPYIVFHDKALMEMSSYFPVNKMQLLQITGVGESKAQRYGERFIEVIRNYMAENDIEIDENKLIKKNDSNVRTTSSKSNKIPSHHITYELYKDNKSIDEITKERNVKRRTIEEHIMKCALEGMEINLNEFINQEHEKLVLEAIDKVGASRLRNIKEIVPDEISYFEIKAIITKSQL